MVSLTTLRCARFGRWGAFDVPTSTLVLPTLVMAFVHVLKRRGRQSIVLSRLSDLLRVPLPPTLQKIILLVSFRIVNRSVKREFMPFVLTTLTPSAPTVTLLTSSPSSYERLPPRTTTQINHISLNWTRSFLPSSGGTRPAKRRRPWETVGYGTKHL